jgi:putative oxidoreductase
MVLRLVVGAVFIAHGAQKLFVFGVPGISSGFAQQGIPFAHIVAPLISVLEFFGGLALVLGALTRFAALGLTIDMFGALLFAHFRSGFFLPNGFEFVLVLAAVTAALVLMGAGAYSIDALMTRRRYVLTSPPRAYTTPRPTSG